MEQMVCSDVCSDCYSDSRKSRIVDFVVFQLSTKADHLVLVESPLLIPNNNRQFIGLKFGAPEVWWVFQLTTLHL